MGEHKVKFVMCHQIPERSFHYRGKQFPICARCTGVSIGYLTLPIFLFNVIQPSLLLIILFIIPMFLDSITQALKYRESNNALRFITGSLGGAAQVASIVLLAKVTLSLIT